MKTTKMLSNLRKKSMTKKALRNEDKARRVVVSFNIGTRTHKNDRYHVKNVHYKNLSANHEE